MAKKPEFDFKHKKPNEIKTAEINKTTNAEQQESGNENKKQAGIGIKESYPAIKPKAEPRNRRVQLLLTESNYSKLKSYASGSGTSVNDTVNQIIESL